MMNAILLRRTAVAAVFAAAAACGGTGSSSAARSGPGGTPAGTAIARENARPGSAGWLHHQAPARTIEGYASQVSIAAGQRLSLHISTDPAARYRIEIYRLGWYGGLGARRAGCLPACGRSEFGTPQPVPPPDPVTGEIRATWPVTDRQATTAHWVSGYYIAEAVLTSGSARGDSAMIPFVVRPARPGSGILVVAPVNTWQAYNTWGGKSLYRNLLGPDVKDYAHAVSFDRPYDPYTSRMLLYWEYPLVRFLERSGYDVDYATDVDVERDPSALARYALVVVAGHSEYWTKGMRDALEEARNAGTNLVFAGGNDGYWQARYSDRLRTLLEYRSAELDPSPFGATKTTRFRDLKPPRPECSLVGVEWQNGWEANGLAPAYEVAPAALANPWFRGTGFTVGSTIPGLVGYEWDAVEPGCQVSPLTVFFHYEGTPSSPDRPPFERSWYSTNADAVGYTAPSGARVFAAGSIQFSWALDGFAQSLGTGVPQVIDHVSPDARLQRFMENMLTDLSTRHQMGGAVNSMRRPP